MKKPNIPRPLLWCTAIVLTIAALTAATLLWLNRPHAKAEARAATVLVVTSTHGEIRHNGKPIAYFNTIAGDSVLTDASADKALVTDTTYSMGCWTNRTPAWPSCQGRVATVDTLLGRTLPSDAKAIIGHTQHLLRNRMATTRHDLSELRYYLRVHGVQDEGYHDIALLTAERAQSLARDSRTLAVLDSVATLKGSLTLSLVTVYEVRQQLDDHTWTAHKCHVEAADTASRLVLLRLDTAQTPHEAAPVVLPPWQTEAQGEVIALSVGGVGEGLPLNVQDTIVAVGGLATGSTHNFPRMLVTDGSPVFNTSGRFLGLVRGRQLIGRAAIRQLMKKGGNE